MARSHQTLGGKYPGEVYTPSACEYHYPEVPEYLFHDRTIRVTQCGRIFIGNRKINLSTVFGGQYVGIRFLRLGDKPLKVIMVKETSQSIREPK